jgi:hypothetical protein
MVGDYISYIEPKQRLTIQEFYMRLSEEDPTLTIDELLFPAFDFQLYGHKYDPYYKYRQISKEEFRAGITSRPNQKGFGIFIIESRMSKNTFDKFCRSKNKSQNTSSSIKESLCDSMTEFVRELISKVFPNLLYAGFKTNFRVLDCEVWTKDKNSFIEHAILYKSDDTELRKF